MSKIELAIKFGSNEIIVFRKGFGIVSRMSSYVATTKNGSRVCAYGDNAKHLCDLKGSQYTLHEPIQGIDIIDAKLAKILINKLIKDCIFDNGKIEALVAVPCALTEKKLLELKVLLNSAGVCKVRFVQNSVCVRHNLALDENCKTMIVDMGKYLVDVSVLTKYEFITGRNYLIGGAEMDNALSTYILDNYMATVTSDQAESIKNELSSMYSQDMYTTTFKALHEQGEYVDITMRANEVRVAIIGVYDKIFDLLEEFMEELPNNVLADVRKYGITFTGGLSNVFGLTEYASKRLKMPTMVVENPKDAVILGAGKLLSLDKEDYPYIKL